jgi:hypothetical protein
MNEAHKQPILNLALGRAYLSAHDPKLCTRTWQAAPECEWRFAPPTQPAQPSSILTTSKPDNVSVPSG